ncbi:UDP-glucuronic acid decarboxylase family protein [Subtercola sp. RTI3]|uniref:UDP-glucuronic acid decarboxylase family protein n=1 Tax=Subtercola sp. RTI3 TaxID=3048639 RepID=UPI002B228F3D|nr:UDP-glucuronic acid decarboxylase family protein [Subtercola sp. RTI3]MEA9984430.1 SDR family oxidoreductase [Subtercola sp. RTI3]
MPLRALVAGGAGFVGSHLSEELLERGYEVVALDNLITGFTDNVSHLVGNPNFSHVNGDAEDAMTLPGHFDLVMHFASPASPPRYLAHPIETLHAGSNATEALLNVAQRDGARFIMASTSEVYGDPSVHPQTEEYWGNVSSTGPRSVYDEAKRYAEALTFAYHRTFGVDTGIVRLFNTYGPRMDPDDGRAVPAFVKAALNNVPIPLHGDGSQTRSLCYIDDQVRGILALAAARGETGPINIGNPHEQSLLEIAEAVIRLTGSTSNIELHPRPVDDPERRQPDITKARAILSWSPEVEVEEGLARTIAWFREHGTFKGLLTETAATPA